MRELEPNIRVLGFIPPDVVCAPSHTLDVAREVEVRDEAVRGPVEVAGAAVEIALEDHAVAFSAGGGLHADLEGGFWEGAG